MPYIISIPVTIKGSTGGDAGTAPLKLESGTFLGTPEAGAIEYDGCKFCVTNVATQRAIDRTGDVAVSTVTVTDTTEETTLWTGVIEANSLCAGNVFKFHGNGIVSNNNSAIATNQVAIRVRVGGNEIVKLEPEAKKIPIGSHWHVNANATQRTLGVAGQRAVHVDVVLEDVTTALVAVATINTTINMNVTLTAEWASASTNNTISLYQGSMEYKN